MRASAVTDEEREAIREDYRNQFAVLSEDIDALLGEEDAQKLKRYSNTLQFRGDVESFERALSYSGNSTVQAAGGRARKSLRPGGQGF